MTKVARSEGTVAWFNAQLGYGFLETTNGQIFVHYTALNQAGYKKLEKDQKVTFIETTTDKGLQAQEVEVLDSDTDTVISETEEKTEAAVEVKTEAVEEKPKAKAKTSKKATKKEKVIDTETGD